MATAQPDLVAAEICKLLGGTLGQPLGSGASKYTYCADVPSFGRVALKILDPAFPAERLAREVDAMQRCAHACIGRLAHFDQIKVAGSTYTFFLEEYLGGGSLHEWVKTNGRLSANQARALGRQLADAVGHLRGQNLVHRDIKPANILLRTGIDTPVLTDFGIVRDLGASALTQSHLAQGPGTPLFASPEQLRNEKNMIDWRTDQFCLGVTLAICVTGMHPYEQAGDSPAACVSRVGQRQGPRASFFGECNQLALAPLPTMVAAWPVHRFRDSTQLLDAWT